MPASFNDESGKRFISPDLDEFSDLLYDNTIARMEASGKYSACSTSRFLQVSISGRQRLH
ncbi:MAG: hypothetical protein U5K54_05620 [Cytophagales bacterium]|nr:hypothetical protein [Cytophagales bacterium]